ncbi:MAG: right-handed parallel beta-helix repeat-containing protein [Phycisphaerales bacterium]|nr:MAG: right-handed parallel beta-helix repeat-containing protein [Phycisphaerales bacterium]
MFPRRVLPGLLIVACFAGSAQAQNVRYVDDDAPGVGNGLAWSTAYHDLQDALTEALGDPTITEIRLASGTYVPSLQTVPGVARTEAFQLINGVTLSGGYRGCPGGDCDSGDPDERDTALYESILTGDLDGDDAAVSCTRDAPDCDSFGGLCIDGLCIIQDNHAENAKHVVRASGVDETAVLDGFTISGGNTNDKGSGMYNEESSPTVTGCTFSGNIGYGMSNFSNCSSTVTGCTFSRNFGGGMYNHWYSSPTVTRCTFSGNTADVSGGGMFNNHFSSPTVINCTFSQNSAFNGNGGGMYNHWYSSPTVTGCTFSENSVYGDDMSRGNGGGMYNFFSCSPTVSDCTFSGNSADTNGGGMSNDSSSPTVTNCTFSGNSAGNGGGMYNDYLNDSMVTNCTFTGNSAKNGGGMYNISSSSPTVTNCTFRGNKAEDGGDGGGMYNVYYSDSTVVNCTFTGNSADTDGGGMYNDWFSDPTVTSCTFRGNSADKGGGIYSFFSSSPTVSNCTFSSNSAGGGGGMHNNGGSPTVTNCTFNGNSATGTGYYYAGGGMYNHGSSPTVTNCILWGNSDASGYGRTSQVSDIGGSLTTVAYSCVQDAVAHDGDVFPGLGNIDTAPLFVDPAGLDGIPGTGDEDLSLLPRSPCIDAGDNTAVPADVHDMDGDGDTDEPIPVDVIGLLRFFDDPCVLDIGNPDPSEPDLGIVDLGAFEYQGDVPGDPDEDELQGCADNCPLHANPDQADCDGDGLGDYCALELGASRDCNGNEIPDECDISGATSTDVDGNGVPDECRRVYYVDDDAPFEGDGLAWTTAFVYLQDALAIAYNGDEIRVAAGTYTPDLAEGSSVTSGDREAAFPLISGVAVSGGYQGCPSGTCYGCGPDERDIVLYETSLSGDLAGDDAEVVSPDDLLNEPTREENSYSVVTGGGTDETALIDGFTITGASASGMYNVSGEPTVMNCTFSGNSARHAGGGMHNISSNPTVMNCTFSGNLAGNDGGGMYNISSSPTVKNCMFSGNSADGTGGGMCNYHGHPRLTNCTFNGNAASEYGGGMYNHDGAQTLTNCILWGNTRAGDVRDEQAQVSEMDGVTYSCIEGWEGVGVGNTGADPLFVDPGYWDDHGTPDDPDDDSWVDGDYHLQPSSPCINTGDNTTPELPETDLDGYARIMCDVVDMGAYEFGMGDYECDGDVCLGDFAAWEACMTGPDNEPYPEGCQAFDFAQDGDVDLEDLAAFQAAFTGSL